MDFNKLEKPLIEIANQIKDLKTECAQLHTTDDKSLKITSEVKALEKEFDTKAREICKNLTPYQRTQIARHPNRPNTTDIIAEICEDFIELHGDRNFKDDSAVIAGIGKLRDGTRAVLIGQQKGRSTQEKMKRNFGMPKPEGYRKALRIMNLAEQFSLPIITFIDTPGAYPGIDAEERGQSEAIATNILEMSRLTVPIVTLIVGEGGSGGALAIAVGNRMLMMQYSVYSVISPEGCASILWKDGAQASRAAELLGITSDIALKNGIIDEIIPEPLGGAHWNQAEALKSISEAIHKNLTELQKLSPEELKEDRKKKFFKMGDFIEKDPISPFRSKTPKVAKWDSEWAHD